MNPTELSQAPSTLRVALALATVYVIWGSTYLAIAIAIETLPPFWMAGVRFVVAGALLYGFSRWRGAPRPTLPHWRSAALIGGLLLLGGNGGVVWAEQRVSSGIAALLVSMVPLWMVLFRWMQPGGERPTKQVWAWGSIYSRRVPLPDSPFLVTGMEMLCGGALLLLVGVLAGEPAQLDLAAVSGRSALALLYLITFGALAGFTAYIWLLKVANPVLVSTYAYVNPIVAVFLGWLILGEPITGKTLIAAAVIVAGVVLITLAQGRSGGPKAKPEPVRAKDEEREEVPALVEA